MNITIEKITNINNDKNFIKYRFNNTNHSIVNALRRTILSDILVYGFNGLAYLNRNNKKEEKKEETVNVIKNTTRLNNEIIKQRLMCIPIHLNAYDNENDYTKITFELDTKTLNLEKNIVNFITTEHFKIKNSSEKEVKKINPFPKDSITDEHIFISKINPKISNQLPQEELNVICRITKHSAKENACFNSVSCCSYSFLEKNEKEKEKYWKKYCKKNSIDFSNDDEKKNWNLLKGKRICHKDKFNFIIESLGIYSCKELLIIASNTLINKFDNLLKNINQKNHFIFNNSLVGIKYSYDIKLKHEDYTIGKVLEYYINKNMKKNSLIFVGFLKRHPHDNFSIIKIVFDEKFKENLKKKIDCEFHIKNIFQQSYEKSINTFKSIKNSVISIK